MLGSLYFLFSSSRNTWFSISLPMFSEYFVEREFIRPVSFMYILGSDSFDVFLELTKGDSCVRKIMYKAQGDGFSRGEALLSAVKRMGWDIQLKFSDFFVLKGEVIKVSGDSVYINLGVSDGVEVGELFDVWWGKRYKGKIRVIRVGDSVSLCRIEKGSVRVGMRVSKSLSNFMVFNFMFGFGGGEAVGVASEINFVIAGIDLAAKPKNPSGICLFESMDKYELFTLYSDEEIVDAVNEKNAEINLGNPKAKKNRIHSCACCDENFPSETVNRNQIVWYRFTYLQYSFS